MSEDVQTGEDALPERLQFCKLPVCVALRHVLYDDDHEGGVVCSESRYDDQNCGRLIRFTTAGAH